MIFHLGGPRWDWVSWSSAIMDAVHVLSVAAMPEDWELAAERHEDSRFGSYVEVEVRHRDGCKLITVRREAEEAAVPMLMRLAAAFDGQLDDCDGLAIVNGEVHIIPTWEQKR